jgi:uncharacterized membrane protein
VKERGVSIVQAARDLDLNHNVLRRWVKEHGFRTAVVIDVGLTLFYTGHAYLFYFAFDCWWPVQPATIATSSSRPD